MPKLLLSFWKDKFVAHPVLKLVRCLLFSVIKDWGILKPDQTILYLKESILVNEGTLFKHKCYDSGYAELSGKSYSFQEMRITKKVPLLKK